MRLEWSGRAGENARRRPGRIGNYAVCTSERTEGEKNKDGGNGQVPSVSA